MRQNGQAEFAEADKYKENFTAYFLIYRDADFYPIKTSRRFKEHELLVEGVEVVYKGVNVVYTTNN